jgi:hypothetical protein
MVWISFQGNKAVGLQALNLERVHGDVTAAEMIALTYGNVDFVLPPSPPRFHLAAIFIL